MLQDSEVADLEWLGYHGAFVMYEYQSGDQLIEAIGPRGPVRGWLVDFMTVHDIEWVRPNGPTWPKEVCVPKPRGV